MPSDLIANRIARYQEDLAQLETEHRQRCAALKAAFDRDIRKIAPQPYDGAVHGEVVHLDENKHFARSLDGYFVDEDLTPVTF